MQHLCCRPRHLPKPLIMFVPLVDTGLLSRLVQTNDQVKPNTASLKTDQPCGAFKEYSPDEIRIVHIKHVNINSASMQKVKQVCILGVLLYQGMLDPTRWKVTCL